MGSSSRWQRLHALHHLALAVDTATWTATFDFALTGPDEQLRLRETVTFPPPPQPPPEVAMAGFRRVLQLLQVAMGTSYYKVAAPRQVVLDGIPLAEPALAWATALYRHGMGEFAYTNDLPHVLELELTAGEPAGAAPAAGAALPDLARARPLVPVGGGKDSLVSVEALRHDFDPVLISVNPNELRTGVMDATGLPQLSVRRTLDSQLFALNRSGAYNGHVPVTAINSLLAVATATLHGLGPVVMSNERSASIPNLTWHEHPINHQWSKGIDAERLLRDALAAQAGLPEAYFSLLRPLSELHIAALYAPFTAYDAVMTSCNAAFRMSDSSARWCGDCPKCRFVFAALAPFVPRDRLVAIFGADLLDDERQLPGYRELAGLVRHKPFECVGETTETLAAFRLLSAQPLWAGTTVVRRLRAGVAHPTWLPDADFARVFRADAPHHLPEPYARALAKLISSQEPAHAPQ